MLDPRRLRLGARIQGGVCGEEDEGDLVGLPGVGEAIELECLDATQVGHVHVQNGQVETLLFEGIQGLLTVLDQAAADTRPFEQVPNDQPIGRIVLRDQDTQPGGGGGGPASFQVFGEAHHGAAKGTLVGGVQGVEQVRLVDGVGQDMATAVQNGSGAQLVCLGGQDDEGQPA